MQVTKSDKVALVSLDGKTVMERDGDRLVFVHNAVVELDKNPKYQ